MALPLPASDRGSLRANVFGFPVSVHLGFLLLGGLLAFSGGLGIARTAVWLAVVTVSVLVHELGHAFVMRSAGAAPTITLYAFGGVTRGVIPDHVSRARRLAVSLAGPAAGLALGAVVFAVAVVAPYEPDGLVEYALGAALFANVAWGVLNLLPLLPLDGGHVLLTLLPGDEARRFRLASIVSVAVGAVATALALYAGLVFGALIAAYFTVGNVSAVRGPRADPSAAAIDEAVRLANSDDFTGAAAVARQAALRDPQLSGFAAQLTAAALLLDGQPADARDELLSQPPGTVDPVLEAAVLIATGNEVLGRERLAKAVAGKPQWWTMPALVAVLLANGEDPVAALDGMRDPVCWERAQRTAFHRGAYAESVRLAERTLASGFPVPGIAALNMACALARLGEHDRAMDALRRAVGYGIDMSDLDTDPDLEPLRGLPEFAALRAGR